jgi:hypothetical protein
MVMGGIIEIWPHGTKITKSYKEDNENNALVYFLPYPIYRGDLDEQDQHEISADKRGNSGQRDRVCPHALWFFLQ